MVTPIPRNEQCGPDRSVFSPTEPTAATPIANIFLLGTRICYTLRDAPGREGCIVYTGVALE